MSIGEIIAAVNDPQRLGDEGLNRLLDDVTGDERENQPDEDGERWDGLYT